MYEVALDAAIAASHHVMQYWPSPFNTSFDKEKVLQIFDKQEGVGNYATIADTESEEIIIHRIKEHPELKDHGILAEESENERVDAPYLWIIDPIDGTLNFRNGMTDFGISIGVAHNNEIIFGVIAMPALGQIIVARQGRGVQILSMDKNLLLDAKQLQIEQPFDKVMISYDLGYEDRRNQMVASVEKFVDHVGYAPSYASASASNYKIVTGSIGAYLHLTPTKYDVAAATCILKELGGKVTDKDGNEIDWHAPTISYLGARDEKIHAELVELLKR